jgi:hypothetical protein
VKATKCVGLLPLVLALLMSTPAFSQQCFGLLTQCGEGLEAKTCYPLTSLRPVDYSQPNDSGWMEYGSAYCGLDAHSHLPCGPQLTTTCDGGSGGGNGGGGGGGGCVGRDAGGVCPAECFTCGQAFGVPRKLPPERTASLQTVVLPPSAATLLRTFAGYQSAHLKARIKITPAGGLAHPSVSPYEYWAKGAFFKLHSPIDPRLGLSEVTDVAFNGQIWQVAIHGGLETTLTIEGRDHPAMPTFLPNPLFLPLWFLSPEDSELCPLCELRLSDLAQLQNSRQALLASAKPPPAGGGGTAPTSFEVTGGRAYEQNVQFKVSLDQAGRVTTIKRSEGGILLDMLTLSDYQTAGTAPFEFPRRLTLARNSAAGAPWLTVDYFIDAVEFGAAVSGDDLMIPTTSVDAAWDNDEKAWLKKPPYNPCTMH